MGNFFDAIYYGKTMHQFFVRGAEHMGTLHLTGKRVKGVSF